MMIEIESVFGDVIVHGERCNENELRKRVKYILSLASEAEFTNSFCMRFGYERLSCTEQTEIDFRIDLDTHMVMRIR